MTRASDAASRTALTLSNLLFNSACVARFDGRLRSSIAKPACNEGHEHTTLTWDLCPCRRLRRG